MNPQLAEDKEEEAGSEFTPHAIHGIVQEEENVMGQLGLIRRRFWVSLVTSAVVLAIIGGSSLFSAGPHTGSAPGGSLALAAGSRTGHTGIRYGGTVVQDDVGGSLWNCSFNPYTSSDTFATLGFVYETLYYVNSLTGKQTPWLASGYHWSNGNKTLTLTIRKAKWTDGKPFSASDVLFTFNLLKKHSALDGNGIWTVLKSARQHGNQVIFNFKRPAVPFFFYIAGQTYIVSKHIWSHVSDPVKYQDKNPVGTGPVKLTKCSSQDMIFSRNPHYWQKGKPYISTLRIPAFIDNQPGNLYLREGNANWGCQYIPNIGTYYISADPAHRHYLYEPSSNNDLYPNVKRYPFNIPAVRKAVSLALDRSQISRIGVYGYNPPANQSGVVRPVYNSWYNSSLGKKYNYSYNPAKAASTLRKAGFKRGSNGYFKKNGKTLAFTIYGNSGFSDWVAELSIVEKNLKAAGIDASVVNIGGDALLANLQSGHFQMGLYFTTPGPGPYYEMHNTLASSGTAPIGSTAASNYERWSDKTTDRLLSQYNTTTSSSRQHAIVNSLQRIMLTKVPVIPLLEAVSWYQYDTKQITGWPTAGNLYVNPGCNLPDQGVLLTHLHLK